MPNDLLYISWPLLPSSICFGLSPTSITKAPGEKITQKAPPSYRFFLSCLTLERPVGFYSKLPQTQTIPALAATWALYYHWPRSLTNGVAAFPPDSINLKDKYPSGRTRFNSSTRPNSASRRFQSLPSQDQHQNMKKISQCSETLPHHPFSKAQSMASFPQNSQVDASHFR